MEVCCCIESRLTCDTKTVKLETGIANYIEGETEMVRLTPRPCMVLYADRVLYAVLCVNSTESALTWTMLHWTMERGSGTESPRWYEGQTTDQTMSSVRVGPSAVNVISITRRPEGLMVALQASMSFDLNMFKFLLRQVYLLMPMDRATLLRAKLTLHCRRV